MPQLRSLLESFRFPDYFHRGGLKYSGEYRLQFLKQVYAIPSRKDFHQRFLVSQVLLRHKVVMNVLIKFE
eukprot:scaffold8334_cov164-Ochromonas_danica.AAC.5